MKEVPTNMQHMTRLRSIVVPLMAVVLALAGGVACAVLALLERRKADSPPMRAFGK